MWINYFDEIFVINLLKRTDRLLQITKDFEEYNIPFTRTPAIEREKGAEGLRDTMLNLFCDCIEQKKENILVFEDDCDIIVPEYEFHDTMNKVVKQLPENYIMCFLGCQITGSVSFFVSDNIISAQQMFSTHAVIYSLQGMKQIIAHGFDFPIDNYYVSTIEPMGRSYCVYPLLCSQKEGFSDIGGNVISWKPFIEGRYDQKVSEFQRKW